MKTISKSIFFKYFQPLKKAGRKKRYNFVTKQGSYYYFYWDLIGGGVNPKTNNKGAGDILALNGLLKKSLQQQQQQRPNLCNHCSGVRALCDPKKAKC